MRIVGVSCTLHLRCDSPDVTLIKQHWDSPTVYNRGLTLASHMALQRSR